MYTDDGISASRYGKKRTAWEALKSDLQQGELLVAWEASRATRDLDEYVLLRSICAEKRVSLAYSGRVLDLTDGDDRFTGGLEFLLAEREAEKIRDRVMRGQRLGAAAGRPHSRPPWGYKRVDRAVWEPDPAEAPRVRSAVDGLLAGETQYAVFQSLRASDGFIPASPTHLFKMLCNPAYAGLRVVNGAVAGKGTWPPLITEEQHRKLMTRRRTHPARPGLQEPTYLLSGIAVCGACDGTIKHTRLGGSGSFYVCADKGHVTRDRAKMDRHVEKELFEFLSRVNPGDFESEDPKVAAAMKEISEIETELEEWTEAAMRREVTPAAFARIEKSLRNRIATLRPQATESRLGAVDVVLLAQNWDQIPMRERREIIRGLFEVVAVPSDKGKRNGYLKVTLRA